MSKIESSRNQEGVSDPGPFPDDQGGPESTILAGLLKSPAWVFREIEADRDWWRRGSLLILAALLMHAAFGAGTGCFSGGWTVVMAMVKAPLIALCSLSLCLPSLYIFCCIGGMRLSLSQVWAMGSVALAVTGLILLGFVPIAWLFAISTSSLGFMTLFTLTIWATAVGFAIRFLRGSRQLPIFSRNAGLRWWLAVYILVSLQMGTAMRPLLADPAGGWWAAGRKNFAVHFMDAVGLPPTRTAADPYVDHPAETGGR